MAASSDLLAPAIWSVGPTYSVLEHLLVIGPYPTVDFFRSFVNRFHPRNVTLVVDEACNKDVVARRDGWPMTPLGDGC